MVPLLIMVLLVLLVGMGAEGRKRWRLMVRSRYLPNLACPSRALRDMGMPMSMSMSPMRNRVRFVVHPITLNGNRTNDRKGGAADVNHFDVVAIELDLHTGGIGELHSSARSGLVGLGLSRDQTA